MDPQCIESAIYLNHILEQIRRRDASVGFKKRSPGSQRSPGFVSDLKGGGVSLYIGGSFSLQGSLKGDIWYILYNIW